MSNAFKNPDPQRVHVAVGADAHQHRREQGQRIWRAGENRPHPFAGEIGRHVLALAEHRGFGEIFPERRMLVARRRRDLHVADEPLIVSRQHAKIVLEPEADREPGGVGRKPEHIKAHAFGQLRSELLERLAVADALENIADLAGLGCFVDAREHRAECAFGQFAMRRIGGIGPEHRRGIADLDAVLAVLLRKALSAVVYLKAAASETGALSPCSWP